MATGFSTDCRVVSAAGSIRPYNAVPARIQDTICGLVISGGTRHERRRRLDVPVDAAPRRAVSFFWDFITEGKIVSLEEMRRIGTIGGRTDTATGPGCTYTLVSRVVCTLGSQVPGPGYTWNKEDEKDGERSFNEELLLVALSKIYQRKSYFPNYSLPYHI
ncbi:uncharacterized protein LOC112467749 [Temnothorax curvispinosus]|uniref:Uncharacterized protein LOC112467749 n=1 Tax=Temnothorax curvispinosus TaxID=300111 RepID=A0A6J1RHW9_9HYME|nr:uncharacterized protein LOC112467749 [Temnothorax curvispinosus]